MPQPMKMRTAPILLLTALLFGFFLPGEAGAQLFKKIREKKQAEEEAKEAAQNRLPELKPGQYQWNPGAAPKGPLLIVVSLDDQMAYVYRNGVMIGRSTVSSGMTGHETPTGVFSILQKNKDHESSIYKGAKMPNMQRLTWTGIALHAGQLPGYPASHGCIRLPLEFSNLLFQETSLGGTVVITKRNSRPSDSGKPVEVLLESRPDSTSIPIPERKPFWGPQRSPSGPLALLISSKSRTLYVYRNGVLIGQSPIGVAATGEKLRDGVFLMLEGTVQGENQLLPGRPMHPWTVLSLEDSNSPYHPIAELRGRLRVHPWFAEQVYKIMTPGTILVVTDDLVTEQTQSKRDFVIMNPGKEGGSRVK